MLKKVAIAGLAVVVGVVLLAWVCPEVYRYLQQKAEDAKQAMADAIPLEDKINDLQKQLTDQENNSKKYYDRAADAKDKMDQLTADVARRENDMRAQWTAMQKLRSDLDNPTTKVSYKGVAYDDHASAQKKLSEDLDAYETAEKALAAEKDLLKATKAGYEAAHEQLGHLDQDNKAMEARLEQMRADLAAVKAREAQLGVQAADNDRANLKAQMDEVDKKIKHRETVLNLHAEFDKGQIDGTSDKPADANILKRFDDKAAEKDGKPAAGQIAEQPK